MFEKLISKPKELKDNCFSELEELLQNIQANAKKALDLLKNEEIDPLVLKESLSKSARNEDTQNVLEGVFNGQNMISSDGKEFIVPPNYASKSKLIEGDLMKLTITVNGSFVYKQIGPSEREQLIATLTKNDATSEYYALSDEGKKWKLLSAAVTYFHGHPGDKVVIVVPRGAKSTWAAVENIIK
ncbi:hypothetical protein C4569_02470 [Candidatus Parcubacteria bacterium]|nr:MAG: hypothetical protein C4569_02470 [Candidatus Parcubacteria bacterium]